MLIILNIVETAENAIWMFLKTLLTSAGAQDSHLQM